MAASPVTQKCVAKPRLREFSPVASLPGGERSGHAMAPGRKAGESWLPAFDDSGIVFFNLNPSRVL